jgi:hypothetical protein
MAKDGTLARSLHDVGLAAWFGGSLMGAVGLNGAAAAVDQPHQRLRVANAGWARWTPVNLAGIVAHLAGGAVLTGANKDRLASQRGVATATITKTTLTGLALAATAYSRMLGAKLQRAEGAPVEDATIPTSGTPDRAGKAQGQLTVLQWAIPALTGATLAVNARMGEQQRPQNVVTGLLQTPRRWLPMAAVPVLAATALAASTRRKRRPDTASQAVVTESETTETMLDPAASLAGR